MCEAMGLIPSTTKKTKEETEKKYLSCYRNAIVLNIIFPN
jgi:hypothetical protein